MNNVQMSIREELHRRAWISVYTQSDNISHEVWDKVGEVVESFVDQTIWNYLFDSVQESSKY